ncbi:MAG: hypothetical protein HUU01_11850 [Saprospiraceae bacterium]|nr:hypothetical protein [Saprospiraceae bacterium]
MEHNHIIEDTAQLVASEFELAPFAEPEMTEEALLLALSNCIADMIQYRLEYLLSLMYRLDIDERKVNLALSPLAEEPANIGLARLVIERQKRRAFTKKHYRPGKITDEDWEF